MYVGAYDATTKIKSSAMAAITKIAKDLGRSHAEPIAGD